MSALNPAGSIYAKLAGEAGAWQRARASSEGGIDQTEPGGFGLAYAGAGRKGQWFGKWPAFLGSADRDIVPSRNGVTARARDLYRNDPVAFAAVARRKNSAIGKGWRLSSKPNALALGVTHEDARELGLKIEAEWKQYAYGYNFQIDAERRLNFGQMLRVAATHLMQDGEFVALVEYAADEPTRYKTRLRMVDPDRLSNPYGRIDTPTLRAGVELNKAGVPLQYHLREQHPFDLGITPFGFVWNAWPRYSTPLGRPQVLHGYDADRAAQHRGISRFAASLKAFRSLARFTDATIQSATINALVLGFIQSSAGPEAISEYFTPDDLSSHEEDRESFYEKNPVTLEDAIFPTIPLGDEIKFATANKETAGFDSFVRSIIRLIAASLGVTYEELAMDYSTTNYSSARAAMIHAWAETVAFMGVIEAQLVRPFFTAWLEEVFDEGYVETADNWPDFYEMPDAYTEARWIGPPRGYIDATKEVLAAAARIELGTSTLEDECAADGKDYMDVLEQLAFEAKQRLRLGLDPQSFSDAQSIQDTKNPAKQAPKPSDTSGDPDQPPVDPAEQRPGDGDGGAKENGSAFTRVARIVAHADAIDGPNARPERAREPA